MRLERPSGEAPRSEVALLDAIPQLVKQRLETLPALDDVGVEYSGCSRCLEQLVAFLNNYDHNLHN